MLKKVDINVHSWDLKSLAFQATTSSTSGGAIERAIGFRPSGLERRGCQEPRHAKRDLVWNRDAPGRDNKQSGFQPTREPTGFQPVEHQFVPSAGYTFHGQAARSSGVTLCCRIGAPLYITTSPADGLFTTTGGPGAGSGPHTRANASQICRE